jgi:hypothetical protein
MFWEGKQTDAGEGIKVSAISRGVAGAMCKQLLIDSKLVFWSEGSSIFTGLSMVPEVEKLPSNIGRPLAMAQLKQTLWFVIPKLISV